MRIDTLRVENFRGFAKREFEFHPRFNVLIGDNATGKTAALEAIAAAASTWFLGIAGASARGIHDEDVRLEGHAHGDEISFEKQTPVVFSATGHVEGLSISWRRSKDSPDPKAKTTYKHAKQIKIVAEEADRKVRAGEPVTLPVIAFYGTQRLWGLRYTRRRNKQEKDILRILRQIEGLNEEEQARILDTMRSEIRVSRATSGSKADLSRFVGYNNCLDPRSSQGDFVRWFERQAWSDFAENRSSVLLRLVRQTISRFIPGAQDVRYVPSSEEVVVVFGRDDVRPFDKLSDGQRSMLSMIGDLTVRMVQLNPHLGDRVFDETPGVVLIDELDMHLHPKWQREISRDLRQTFPSVQFITATHSPLIIGETEPESVLLLNDPAVRVPTASQSYGLDANLVLTWVMGTGEAQAEAVVKRRKRAHLAIQEGDLDEAQVLSEQVRDLQRGPTPDTVELDTTIANLEALAEDEDDHQG